MKKVFFIFTILTIVMPVNYFSQSFNVRRIFNSVATGGAEFLPPSSINDSINFQLTKYKVQFVKVLRTKGADLDNKKAKANQLFLISKFSVTNPSASEDNYYKTIYNGELEFIYMALSRKERIN